MSFLYMYVVGIHNHVCILSEKVLSFLKYAFINEEVFIDFVVVAVIYKPFSG